MTKGAPLPAVSQAPVRPVAEDPANERHSRDAGHAQGQTSALSQDLRNGAETGPRRPWTITRNQETEPSTGRV